MIRNCSINEWMLFLLRRESNYVNHYCKNWCHWSFSLFALKLLGFISADTSRHVFLRRPGRAGGLWGLDAV